MKRGYMDVYEEILQKKVSSSKKSKLLLARSRYKKKTQEQVVVVVPEQFDLQSKRASVQATYIDKMVDIMNDSQKALESNPNAPIRIEEYGDYAMSVFRKKDRIKRLEDIPRLFTNDFKKKLIDSFPAGCEQLIEDLIKGRVKAASLAPQAAKEPKEERMIYRRRPTKNLQQLNSSMHYEYSPEKDQDELKFGYMKLYQKEESLRVNSLDKLGERRKSTFLPQIVKNNPIKKGLIFMSQGRQYSS